MHTATLLLAAAASAASLTTAPAAPASADCTATYRYAAGMGHVDGAVDVTRGQTATLNRTNLLLVRNIKARPLRARVSVPTGGTKWVLLSSAGAVDPAVGQYMGNVTLIAVSCEYLYPDAAAMIASLKMQNQSVAAITAAVRQEFGTSGGSMAQLLITQGLVNGLAAALRNAYSAPANQVAGWLRGGGMALGTASQEVRNGFLPADRDQVIGWLAAGGYPLDEFVVARQQLKALFGASSSDSYFRGQLVGSLRLAGFNAAPIAASYFQHNASQGPAQPFDIAISFRYAHRPLDEIAGALKDGLAIGGADVAAAMRQANGFYGNPLTHLTIDEVAQAVRSVFPAGGAELLVWLHIPPFWQAAQVGSTVRTIFNASGATMTQWLRQSQQPIAFSAAVLDLYQPLSRPLALWLHDAGYSLDEALALYMATDVRSSIGGSAPQPKSPRGVTDAFGRVHAAKTMASLLLNTLTLPRDTVARVLPVGPYTIEEIGGAYQSPLHASALQAATWAFQWAGNDEGAASILRNAYGLNATDNVALLQEVKGRPAITSDRLRFVLSMAGYSQREIDVALR